MVLAPGQSSSDAVENEHPYAEQWLLVLSGTGSATVGKRHVKLSLHSLLLIEKREPHRITNSGKSDLATLNIYCPPAYSKEGDVLRSVAPPRRR
ncbi:MAG TPA: cupin domain-containing protein [Phycisphaerae bacterium]|jgi:mannose-6-phosphate isomerase-like protein (cupin superfamily)